MKAARNATDTYGTALETLLFVSGLGGRPFTRHDLHRHLIKTRGWDPDMGRSKYARLRRLLRSLLESKVIEQSEAAVPGSSGYPTIYRRGKRCPIRGGF